MHRTTRSMISLFFLAALSAAAIAQIPVLRFPGFGTWPESGTYTVNPVPISRWWSSGSFIDSDPCVGLAGAELTACQAANPLFMGHEFSWGDASGNRSVFVPNNLWFFTPLFAASSLNVAERAIGEYLRDLACPNGDCSFELGVGNQTDTTPDAYFPRDYWELTVAVDTPSFGALKALYGNN